ncbi:DUF6620 family protein [Enhygromyxa salina]|uniref:Uncharacterized protein n=1 Tax=Enhygromyxa salina TaxID=215803 RepID=A0A2S9YDV2_9BACT|nr:DUF6620 family protein [Enhygromyxa salina]PRQ03186.1 hypothetical protein ENSA7_53260 [Enhygromyxa salina]
MGLLDTILSALGLRKQVQDNLHTPPVASATATAAAAAVAADDDDDDDDDDGEGRDFALEAVDDRASFDFDNDVDRYFAAQFRIEQNWDDEDDRGALFGEYGIRSPQHWYQVKATFERWSQSPAARAKYPTDGDLMQAQMDATQKVAMQSMNIGNQHAALAEDLAPVEGVTLEQWAKAQAGVASGGDVNQLIAGLGVDKAAWDRISAEWNARMSRDTSFTITMEYSKHFGSAGVGQFAGASASAAAGEAASEADAPITLERYVEIEVAQSAGSSQGKDAAGILKSFGMSPMEWGQVGGWWSLYMSKNAMRNNGELHARYTKLHEQFEAKYATASADDDISF